jgi:hypothetical protein
MKVPKKLLAIALVSIGLLPLVAPDASAHCARRVLRRHHVAVRTIATTRVIVQPAVIAQPVVTESVVAVPACGMPVVQAVPVCVRRRHHLLGIYTPLFGFHLL